MYRFVTVPALALLMTVGLLSTTGCDSSGPGEGTLRLYLTDAPIDDYVSEVNVTVEAISIINGSVASDADTSDSEEGEELMLIEETQEQFNLLALQDSLAFLAEEEIPAGSYSQIRLQVSDVSLVLENGETIDDVKCPSCAQSGLKVLLPSFTVESDAETELALDFNVEESFHLVAKGGGQITSAEDIQGVNLRPVIKPMPVDE